MVDNDDGGKKLFDLAGKKSGRKISYDSPEPFYYLGLNLYFIKTPENATAPHTSSIEDFFDPAVLATNLGGKVFDPNIKDHDEAGKYGKTAFATRVIEPNADKINFTGFAPLLNRIVAALDHHAALK